MSFCVNCGTKIEDGVFECPNCGTRTQEAPKAANSGFGDKLKGLNNTADCTEKYDAKDVNDNKGMSVLSYFGLLFLVPLLARKESKFARFHANQGLLLLIADIGYAIIHSVIMAILSAIFPWYTLFGFRGFIYSAISLILSLGWIVFTVLAIIGIVNAVNGRAKELPVIGKFRILK